MKSFLFIATLVLSPIFASAQSTDQSPEFHIDREEIEVQMHFLASDFLQGRRTGSLGNDIAANYIAAHLKAYGYAPPAEQDDFFQAVPLNATSPPQKSSMVINKNEFTAGDDFIILSGEAAAIKTGGVFAGYGWIDEDSDHNDYTNLDVKGKVVFVLPGEPGKKDPMSIFNAMKVKAKFAADHGAVALVELYQLPFPWEMFAGFFGGETLRIADEEDQDDSPDIVYAWMNKTDALTFEEIQEAKKLRVELNSSGFNKESVSSNNVIGVLEGSDPELKDEYILLTAHFDHVGVGSQGGAYTEQDSIFNGARDNVFGTVSLLAAAKALSEERPKRSVIILAVTGEELGLLGSSYYADHPLVPLEQTIFNLNTDGAGYSTTDAVAVFGWDRTGTNEQIEAGSAAFGLEVIHDPAPEQGLFDRSDNASFAAKGVPALSFAPGFREFGEEILEHYHQVSDEADSIDFEYLQKYAQAFAHTARLIADMSGLPVWKAGDKYEEAGKELYQNKPRP